MISKDSTVASWSSTVFLPFLSSETVQVTIFWSPFVCLCAFQDSVKIQREIQSSFSAYIPPLLIDTLQLSLSALRPFYSLSQFPFRLPFLHHRLYHAARQRTRPIVDSLYLLPFSKESLCFSAYCPKPGSKPFIDAFHFSSYLWQEVKSDLCYSIKARCGDLSLLHFCICNFLPFLNEYLKYMLPKIFISIMSFIQVLSNRGS